MDEALARQIEAAVKEIADEASAEATAVLNAQQRVVLAAEAFLKQRKSPVSALSILAMAQHGMRRAMPTLDDAAMAEGLNCLAVSLDEARASAFSDRRFGIQFRLAGPEGATAPSLVLPVVQFMERAA